MEDANEHAQNNVIRLCEQISNRRFTDFYVLMKKVICRGDFFEIKQCKNLKSDKFHSCKIFRKAELSMKPQTHPNSYEKIISNENGERLTTEEEGFNPGLKLVTRELELLSALDHPNILKVQEAFEDKHKIYFVMEELKGETLFERIIS